MATRETKVRLSADVQGYIADMDKAAKATRETGTEAEKLAQKGQAIRDLGIASMAMGTLAAAGVGLAISKWANFDEAMSQVQAATGESEEGMKRLSDAALDAGARTVFSAEESANAIEELAKAGVDTADILNGALDGALDLAAAGGLGVADAAGIAATALKTFNLEGSDMGHVADLLAAGAGKAMGDVTDLSAALNQSAMVANATGLSIEETTAGLAAFASQGLLGSDAGTSFKTMLMSLSGPTGKAQKEMERLGISAFDASGEFVGLSQFAGTLERGLAGMSKEQQQATLKTIFGSDAIRAATVLYSEGAEGIAGWVDAVDDQGFAAEQAAARLDNLKGDLEALGGALDTALIKTGSSANDVLRGMVQSVSAAVDAYNELPAPLQSAAMGVGVLVAGVGLLGGAALLAIPKIAEFKIAMSTLGVTAVGTSRAMMSLYASLGVALAAAAISVAAFNHAIEEGKTPQSEFQGALAKTTDLVEALQLATRDTKSNYWTDGFRESLEDLPGLMDRVQAADGDLMMMTGFADQKALENLKQMGVELAGLASTDFASVQQSFAAWTDGMDEGQVETLLNQMPDLKAAFGEAATEIGHTADIGWILSLAMGDIDYGAEKSKRSLEGMQGVAVETTDAVAGLADEIEAFGDVNIKSERSTIAFKEELAKLKKQAQESAGGVDENTEAGRKNRSALLDTAEAAKQAAADAERAGKSQGEVSRALRDGRKAIVAAGEAFGMSRKDAKAFADEILVTSETLKKHPAKATAEFDGSKAKSQFAAWLSTLEGKTVTVTGQMALKGGVNPSAALNHANGGIVEYANGGMHEFANGGGVQTGIYSGGTPIIKFAEPETGWEAFISGKPSERDRNRQIWMESGNRLGMADILKAFSAPQQGKSVNIDSVTFSSPQQRDQWRDFEDTIHRIERSS